MVEIINLALITKKTITKDGTEYVVREQRCSEFDWVEYIKYWEAEVYQHAEGMRKQKTGNARIVELNDDMSDEEL